MFYCQDLTEEERLTMYTSIQHKVNEEASSVNDALLLVTLTEFKKEAYLDQFKGEWFSLLCLWMESKATNEYVRECLSSGNVMSN